MNYFSHEQHARLKQLIVVFLLVTISVGFFSLGVWQLHRRAWKHDLIEHINARIHAPPVDAPQPREWPRVSDADSAYSHVSVHGAFLSGYDTFVETTTKLGQGFWLLRPLKTDEGFIVLVNRGFIPADMSKNLADTASPLESEITITGLLRITETGGRFLRANQPEENKWYSRDVAAIAATRGLTSVAPYFIDEDVVASDTWPRGGMTVITFPDNHLVYALTWIALAFMSLFFALRHRRD